MPHNNEIHHHSEEIEKLFNNVNFDCLGLNAELIKKLESVTEDKNSLFYPDLIHGLQNLKIAMEHDAHILELLCKIILTMSKEL
jgi:hypothetical protein